MLLLVSLFDSLIFLYKRYRNIGLKKGYAKINIDDKIKLQQVNCFTCLAGI
jgi:hypothetical protein